VSLEYLSFIVVVIHADVFSHRRRSQYARYATGVAYMKVVRQGYVLA